MSEAKQKKQANKIRKPTEQELSDTIKTLFSLPDDEAKIVIKHLRDRK